MSKYYAVRKGRETGIFRSWGETEPLVKGFKGSQYKSFKNQYEAQAYLGGGPVRKFQPVEGRKPPPNFPGYGVVELLTQNIVIYTDGSCVDKVGGYGFVVLDIDGQTPVSGKVPSYPTTNQVAELYAIYQALNYAITHHPGWPIIIYTDSKYSIGCLTQWCWNWQRNGWVNSKGEPVANQELIRSVLDIMKDVKAKFLHVKAHNGDMFNETADRLANEGRFK